MMAYIKGFPWMYEILPLFHGIGRLLNWKSFTLFLLLFLGYNIYDNQSKEKEHDIVLQNFWVA